VVAQPNSPSSRRRAVLLVFITLTLIAFIQLSIITAGLHKLPTWSNYTSRLATAFIHRQLSLMSRPSPQLLALPNPYDPIANDGLGLHDAVLFGGKYYLYWGPAPAVLLAAVCLPLGIDHPDFTDAWLVIPFALGALVFTAALMVQTRARFFPKLNLSTVAAPILSFGLGAPVLYTLARPAIYEVAIFGAQFFLLAGLCAAFRGMARGTSPRWLACAGLLWAISVACRVTLLPAIVAAELVTLAGWRCFSPSRDRAFPPLAVTVGLIGPLLAMMVLLGWYNFARFGHWTEFGFHFQLASQNQYARTDFDTFSLRYLPVNLYEYVFAAPNVRSNFPFIHADSRLPWFADVLEVPQVYNGGPLVGLLWAQPFLLLTLPSLWLARKAKLFVNGNQRTAPWLISILLTLGLLAMAPIVMFQCSAMRFFLDGLPCAAILAALGYWTLIQSLQNRPRLASRIQSAAAILIIVQCVLGLFLSVTGDWEILRHFNPDLYHTLYRYFDGP
jgi:hypothetical protein